MPSIPKDPGGREQKEGCLSDTRSHPGLGAESSAPLLQTDGQFGKRGGERENTFYRITTTTWVGTGS